jgi:N-acylglucosamine 2-epimerase
VWEWADDPEAVGRPQHAGQPDAQSLAVPMILLNLIEVVADGDPTPYRADIDACIQRIEQHIHPDTQHVFETVCPDGSRLDGAEGRLLNPGHAIEAGWFLQHWALRLQRPDLQATATNVVRWSYATGWDDDHGGIFYFLDAEDYAPTQLEWFMKLWWPHCEALYAHLLNYVLTGSDDDWDAFTTVDQYAFDHFADPKHGEWFGYLNRRGTPTHLHKGAPYKGCFHVPRSLWLCRNVLLDLEASAADCAA